MYGLPLLAVLVGGIFGLGDQVWAWVIILVAFLSALLAIAGRDTKLQIVESTFLQFGILFVVLEGAVLLAYMVFELDLLAQIARL